MNFSIRMTYGSIPRVIANGSDWISSDLLSIQQSPKSIHLVSLISGFNVARAKSSADASPIRAPNKNANAKLSTELLPTQYNKIYPHTVINRSMTLLHASNQA